MAHSISPLSKDKFKQTDYFTHICLGTGTGMKQATIVLKPTQVGGAMMIIILYRIIIIAQEAGGTTTATTPI